MFLRSKKKQSVVRPVCGVLAVLGILLFWFAATTNAAAAEVMQAEGVIVNDLYALVKPRAEKLLADGVHFTGNGSIVLAEAVAGAIQKALEDPREPDGSRELISAIGSETATNGEGGKIATFGGKTHVVWQDRTKQGYFNVVRSLDHATGEWSETFTLNRGLDNHARPIITVDHNGYLHALMGGHNSPVTYRRSVRPNDSSEWTDPEPAGSGTHPVMVCGPDDTLYLVMRSSNRWNGVDLYVKPPGKPWKKLHKLVKRHEQYPGFGAFHSGLAFGPDGTLHLVADFFESLGVMDRRGMHQAVCYMRSRDGGQTWQKADGTPVSLPARPEDMDILARDTAKKRHEPMALPVLLSQGCLVVDSQGTPHILYMSHLEEPGQLILATADDQGQWNRQPIEAIKKAYPRMRPVNCRGALSIAEDNRFYVLLDLYPLDVGWTDEKPTRGMAMRQPERRKLVWLISGDEPNAFTTAPALEAGATCHQPNLERPTGVNRIPAGRRPGFIYYDGQKNVYFVGPQ